MGELGRAMGEALGVPKSLVRTSPAMQRVHDMLTNGTIPEPEENEVIDRCATCGAVEKWVKGGDGKMAIDRMKHDRAVHLGNKSQTRELNLEQPKRATSHWANDDEDEY